MTTILPIAIDLGAKHTGCFFAGVGDPASGARGVFIEVDPKALTLQQTQRRQMRHLRRNYKRRRLAKQLILLWLADRWPTDADAAEIAAAQRFLRGLMNRRGFTHFSLDERIDPERLDAGRDGLVELGMLQANEAVADWVKRMAADPDEARSLLLKPEFKLRDARKTRNRQPSSELSDYLRQRLGSGAEKSEVDALAKALAHIRDLLAEAAQADQTGHKPRRLYLQEVSADLANTAEGKQALRLLQLDASTVANLVGHISNLNLPGLRGYFHDPDRLTPKSLDVKRFLAAWIAFFRRWALVGETGERRNTARRHRKDWLDRLTPLEHERDIVALRQALWLILSQTDPLTSIPPFEAQTNRRPPQCQSLLLVPAALTRLIPGGELTWRAWSQALQRANPELCDGLDRIGTADARVIGRAKPGDELTNASLRWRDARFLQRLLDRSREIDGYKLRLLAASIGREGSESQAAVSARDKLATALGSQHVKGFLDFAQRYYGESRQARTGIWSTHDEVLLERCDAHPPHKRNIVDLLVAQVLSLGDTVTTGLAAKITALASERVAPQPQVLASSRGTRSPRARTIARVFEDCADQVKQQGGDLRLARDRAAGKAESDATKAEKAAAETYVYAAAAANRLGLALGLDARRVERFANPYSIAQLQQVLFVDPSGFNSTCKGCTYENAWRARIGSDGIANGARLPADSIRPFDGVLARLLEAKARRIADAFFENMPAIPAVGPIRVPVLVEENRFSFVAQLAEVKGAGAKSRELRGKLEIARQEQERSWSDKWERIRADGGGLCPYCGQSIGESGDFDHIVGQALTRELEGYAFDSEANLVFAHRRCNQAKGRQVYALSNLGQDWLRRHFGFTDLDEIRNRVHTVVQPWLDARGDRRAFHQLEQALRLSIRHALFIPELRGGVLSTLAMQNVARVNGTQRWFGRILVDRLRASFLARKIAPERLDFSLHRVRATDVAELRRTLGQTMPAVVKPEQQGPYSHVIDATLVYAVASSQPTLRYWLGLGPAQDDPNLLEFLDADRALALLPRGLLIRRIERTPIHQKDHPWHRPLFKANPIGERFVPLMVDAEARVWCGFDTGANRFELSAGRGAGRPGHTDARLVILRTLWPALTRTPADVDAQSDGLLAALAAIATQRPHRVVWLQIDRTKAFKHWMAVRTQPEDKLGNTLDKLVYRVQRVAVEPLLFPTNSDSSPAREGLLAEDNFKIAVDLPGAGKGKLRFPAFNAWQRLVDDPRLSPHLGKKLSMKASERSTGDDVSTDVTIIDWQAIARDHFPRAAPNRLHKRMRQTYALPRRVEASGGFRVTRTGPDASPVFQLVQVEKGAYAGFARAADAAGFDSARPALLPVFSRASRITPAERRAPVTGKVFGFEDSLEYTPDMHPALGQAGIIRIRVFAGTVARRKLTMKLPWSRLPEVFDIAAPSDPRADIIDTGLRIGSASNAERLAEIKRLEGIKAAPGRTKRSERDPVIKELRQQCETGIKRAKVQLADLLANAIGIPGLSPRDDTIAVDAWDQDTVSLSWTAR